MAKFIPLFKGPATPMEELTPEQAEGARFAVEIYELAPR
jgi:hypothetical protein